MSSYQLYTLTYIQGTKNVEGGSANIFNYFMLVSKSINTRKEPTKKQNSLSKNSEETIFIRNI